MTLSTRIYSALFALSLSSVAYFTVTAAYAADLRGKRNEVSASEPIYDSAPPIWQGLYWGASIGYGWGTSEQYYDRAGNHGMASTDPDRAQLQVLVHFQPKFMRFGVNNLAPNQKTRSASRGRNHESALEPDQQGGSAPCESRSMASVAGTRRGWRRSLMDRQIQDHRIAARQCVLGIPRNAHAFEPPPLGIVYE